MHRVPRSLSGFIAVAVVSWSTGRRALRSAWSTPEAAKAETGTCRRCCGTSPASIRSWKLSTPTRSTLTKPFTAWTFRQAR